MVHDKEAEDLVMNMQLFVAKFLLEREPGEKSKKKAVKLLMKKLKNANQGNFMSEEEIIQFVDIAASKAELFRDVFALFSAGYTKDEVVAHLLEQGTVTDRNATEKLVEPVARDFS